MERLSAYSLTLLTQPALRALIASTGARIVPPWAAADAVAGWGRKRAAERGIAAARRRGLPFVSFEDAPLRGLLPGQGVGWGCIRDRQGIYFDCSTPSDLEDLLNAPREPTGEAEDALELMRHYRLSKYNGWDADGVPKDRFVLIVDQSRGDASVTGAGATEETFRTMILAARAAHPGVPLAIRAHPAGSGYLSETPGVAAEVLSPRTNPWDLLDRAEAVYTVSSQLGFEAILAGHRPHVFGGAFYAGWGLTEDRVRLPRRETRLSVLQLFDAVMLRYAHWADPVTQTPCSLSHVIEMLAAQARAYRMTSAPMRVYGVRPWKRQQVSRFLSGAKAPVRFAGPAPKRSKVVWASREDVPAQPDARIEDGFVRSRGLGAKLVPPGSLVLDRAGIYFDPHFPSDLEQLIAGSVDLPPAAIARADRLIGRIVAEGVSKYNLAPASLLETPSLLVVGQVEDDASIRRGTGPVRTNAELIRAARAENPEAYLVYRPHPDVAAGLRAGTVDAEREGADRIIADGDITTLWPKVEAVWALTSLAGFEALIRGGPVHCLGAPFDAGWGLTLDRWTEPFAGRREARPRLAALVHACLIDYPMYLDPLSGRHCSVEVALDRLSAAGTGQGASLRLASAALSAGRRWRRG